MKNLHILVIFFFLPFLVFSQSSIKKSHGEVFGSQLVIIISENTSIKGSKYLLNEWEKGFLVINDSIFTFQEKIMFDQSNGDLLIGNNLKEGLGFIVTDKKVTGFVILRPYGIRRVFTKLKRSNFNISSEFYDGFFEVITNKMKSDFLIKKTIKYIFDSNLSKGVATTNDFAKQYKEKVSYYIKNSNKNYKKVKLNKNSILKALINKKIEIKKYVLSNKISYKKEQDVIRILEYYHSIL